MERELHTKFISVQPQLGLRSVLSSNPLRAFINKYSTPLQVTSLNLLLRLRPLSK